MSKAQILNSISKNKPDPVDLPAPLKIPEKRDRELIQEFVEKAESAGSEVEILESSGKLEAWIMEQEGKGKSVINLALDSKGSNHLPPPEVDPDRMDMVIIKGPFGVAENGAVWITEHDMHIRSLPFVTSHLVLVLEKAGILPDMHAAYQQVDLEVSGFGVFIAGPSKTADIEQSLVIGAHGPVKHTILLL